MAQSLRSPVARPPCFSRLGRSLAVVSVACFSLPTAVGAWAQASSTTAQHAHVHGTAKLGIAVQGGTVSITFESPLDSLIGFEHRPTTPAQQNAVDALQARMRAAKGLVGFDAAAGCELAKAEAESALFQPAAAGAGADAHADLDAAFEFRCSHPERLSRVDIGLFAAYPRLQHLDVEVVTANGQFKRDLKRPATTVELKR